MLCSKIINLDASYPVLPDSLSSLVKVNGSLAIENTVGLVKRLV